MSMLMELFSTLPDSEATEILLEKIAKAYGTHFKVQVVDIVWIEENIDESEKGLRWIPIGRFDPRNRGWNPPPWAHGLFYICLKNKSAVWAKELRKLAIGKIDQIAEVFSGETIGKHDYWIGNKSTDEEIVIPMINKGNVVGLINVECDHPDVLSEEIIRELKEIAEPLANIIEKSEADRERREQMRKCVREVDFRDIELLRRVCTCFLARPFRDEFVRVEESLQEELKKFGTNIEIAESEPPDFNVFKDIAQQIQSCHFGIADITGMNPNILIEVGLMIGAGKPVMLIQDTDDQTEIPFDLKGRHIFRYKRVKETSGKIVIRFLEKFLKSLNKVVDEVCKLGKGCTQ